VAPFRCRRSLLTQSPLEDASPINAPKFKSPPRAQANKNYGKMRFLPGRRTSGQSVEAEEASLEEDESLESEDGTGEETAGFGNGSESWRKGCPGAAHVAAGVWLPDGKKRKLAFAEPEGKKPWKSWQVDDDGKAGGEPPGGVQVAYLHPSSAPLGHLGLDNGTYAGDIAQDTCNAVRFGGQNAVYGRTWEGGGHVAAPTGDTLGAAEDDDFLEGLDLDRIEAEALAARSQQPIQRLSGNAHATLGVAAPGFSKGASLLNTGGTPLRSPSEANGLNNQGLPQKLVERRLVRQCPRSADRSALSGGRLRKRTSLVDDDSMPSFDLGVDWE
jgi:hypothetical protein